MTTTEISPVRSRACWRAQDIMEATKDWIHELTPAEIDELDAALAHAKGKGVSGTEVTREDFPLPTLAPLLEQANDEVSRGLGLFLIRGLPVRNYSKEDASTIFWGAGTYFGNSWPQNLSGDLLGNLLDTGKKPDDMNVRYYQTNEKLGFHTDGADIVALLCLRVSKSGGGNHFVSSMAIHDEMAEKSPELLECLYEPFCVDWRGDQASGAKPFYTMPIFTRHNGYVSSFYLGEYIESAQRFDEVPKLTPLQRKALNHFESLCWSDEFRIDLQQQPGDMSFISNFVTLHAREKFEDFDDPDEKRHLRRLWLASTRTEHRPPLLQYLYDQRIADARREMAQSGA
ncbi:MAG: TauD/TfdA family dioxygenase [bacterium]|nr:TauD/TfdA family dioxygenase [bacterium]